MSTQGFLVPLSDSNSPSERFFLPPKVGDVVNVGKKHFYLGEQINHGSFAAVFECFDEWNNPLVAKVLLPNAQTYEQVREKWEREFQALFTVRHPCITFIHEAFEWRDTFYIIVERCTCSLRDLISVPNFNGNVWFPELARDLLQALAFIHPLGQVHKDVHPGNILLHSPYDAQGRFSAAKFKLADFGISRLEDQINPATTLIYQSAKPPEFFLPQVFGQPCRRADIYQAALCMLYLLRGEISRFTPAEILAGIPRQMAERLEHPCAPAIARALRRHVADRTACATEFWEDLLFYKSDLNC